jgi:hypothetical protein
VKLRITKPDGTVLDVEGTPEECARFAGLAPVPQPWPDPVYIPHVYPTTPWDGQPWWRWEPYCGGQTSDRIGDLAYTLTFSAPGASP